MVEEGFDRSGLSDGSFVWLSGLVYGGHTRCTNYDLKDTSSRVQDLGLVV